MTEQAPLAETWSPAADDELTWLKPVGAIPVTPRPLEYSVEVWAIVFGLNHALQSLYFPLYELRSRLLNGRLYLAVVPLPNAERDLLTRRDRMRDYTLRYTRNMRGAWEADGLPEVERYNKWFATLPDVQGTTEALDRWTGSLRRNRGNQWYTVLRSAMIPSLLLRRRVEETEAGASEYAALSRAWSDSQDVVHNAVEIVGDMGGALVRAALPQLGQRLSANGSIDLPGDVFWLEINEVRQGLRGGRQQDIVAQRKDAEQRFWPEAEAPAVVGPSLPADAPRMFLVPEVLASIGITIAR